MKLSDSALKGRKLKREEAILLLLSALVFEDFLEGSEGYKNRTFTLTQRDMTAALFAFGKKMMSLYASGSLEKAAAEPIIAKEKSIIADMKVAGVDMDKLLKGCETEDEII